MHAITAFIAAFSPSSAFRHALRDANIATLCRRRRCISPGALMSLPPIGLFIIFQSFNTATHELSPVLDTARRSEATRCLCHRRAYFIRAHQPCLSGMAAALYLRWLCHGFCHIHIIARQDAILFHISPHAASRHHRALRQHIFFTPAGTITPRRISCRPCYLFLLGARAAAFSRRA